MIEKKVNIFDEIKNPDHLNKLILLLITTNGVVKNNGDLVMGAGLAKEAVNKFKELNLPKILGIRVSKNGNIPSVINTNNPLLKLISFPTKNNWKDNSKISLIENSMKHLVNIIYHENFKNYIIITGRPGCSLGGLNWDLVKKVLQRFEISKNMIVCDNQGNL